TMIIGIIMFFTMNKGLEQSIRDSLFQVISIMTTTGYVTSDYELWIPILGMLIFVLMFFGGSAGSTGGGVKIIRVVLLMKNSLLELKRLIHPNAVIPVRYNNRAVDQQVITNVLAFVSFYILTIVGSMIVMASFGYDMDTSIGAVAATLGNIGPGIGDVGPVDNFSHIPAFGKWFLSLLMLIGRLELFTVLILFSSEFWRQ
ncbi:MAG: potassium transporter TrkG, partial [Bacteroidota bacterium]